MTYPSLPNTTRTLNLFAFIMAVLGALFGGRLATAQPAGYVAGTAADAATGEPLAGVNVSVQDTRRGAAAGPDGRFFIGPLGAGDYTLQARFVGYQQETLQVQVAAGDTVRVQLALAPRTVGLETVVVTARRDVPEAREQLQKA